MAEFSEVFTPETITEFGIDHTDTRYFERITSLDQLTEHQYYMIRVRSRADSLTGRFYAKRMNYYGTFIQSNNGKVTFLVMYEKSGDEKHNIKLMKNLQIDRRLRPGFTVADRLEIYPADIDLDPNSEDGISIYRMIPNDKGIYNLLTLIEGIEKHSQENPSTPSNKRVLLDPGDPEHYLENYHKDIAQFMGPPRNKPKNGGKITNRKRTNHKRTTRKRTNKRKTNRRNRNRN